MRQSIVTHNPFLFARGTPDKVVHVEAKFELRARIRNQIEALDRDIQQAMRARKPNRVIELTERRNRLVRELP